MYMHCIPHIGDECLALFCETLRRNIIFFRRVFVTLPSFEDEDFCPDKNKTPLTTVENSSLPLKETLNSYFDCSNKKLIDLLQMQQERLKRFGEFGSALCSRLNLVAIMLKFEEHFSDFLAVLVEEDIGEAYGSTTFKGYSAPIISDAEKPIQSIQMTAEMFISDCENVLKDSSELVAISKLLYQTANLGRDAGPGKANPKSDFYHIPGFEPYLTLSALTATVQRFPRSLSRTCVFSFLGCAFSRVYRVVDEMKLLILANPLNIIFFHEMYAVSHRLGHNICHCLFQKDELSQPLEVEDASSRSCALSRAILSVMMGALLKCPVNVDQRITEGLAISSPVMHYLASWLAVEPKWVRELILQSSLDVRSYASFLETVFLSLYKVCRCYTLNRSRQRTLMSRLFEDLNNLIEEAISTEATLSMEFVGAQANPNASVVPLHVTSYICFFYYHLVFDYLITGFQLDLYAPREWVYVYALIITLQRNLSTFVSHMARGMSSLPPEAASTSNSSTTGATNSKRRRRKRGPGSSRAAGADSRASSGWKSDRAQIPQQVIDNLPSVSSEYWTFQIAQANLHRFLSLATLYVLRALQRDCGMDIKTMKHSLGTEQKLYSSLKTQFLHRMGPAIDSRFSPLLGNETADAFFDSTHEYVTSETFTDLETKELYEMAGKVFGVARQWILAINMPVASTSGFIGPVDGLAQLDHLAKNNVIVCRLLVARPEKRPQGSGINSDPLLKQSHPFHPVHLEFQHLLSRAYPLLRLV